MKDVDKMRYHVGDVVTIIKEEFGHEFEIGEKVTIVAIERDGSYEATNGKRGKWWVEDSEITMAKTLQEYLEENYEQEIIDHTIRVFRNGDGVKFYIHPNVVDGDTLDFEVKNNTLSPVNQIV